MVEYVEYYFCFFFNTNSVEFSKLQLGKLKSNLKYGTLTFLETF